jgi:hypothetical protein
LDIFEKIPKLKYDKDFKRCLKDFGISFYFFDKALGNTLDTEEIYSPSIDRTANLLQSK